MDTSQFDDKVREIEEEIETIRREGEQAFQKCIAEATAWLVTWSEHQIDSAMVKYPATVKSLGPDRLKTIAGEVRELKARLPQLVRTQLEASGVWVHRYNLSNEPGATISYSPLAPPYSNSINSDFEGRLRELLGHTGKILVDNNLAFGPPKDMQDWQLGALGSLPRFRFGFTISTTFREALSAYDTIGKTFVDKCNERAQVLLKKVQAEARDAWDQAKS